MLKDGRISEVCVIIKIKLDCDPLKNSPVLYIELHLIYATKRIAPSILVSTEKFIVLFVYMYSESISENFHVSTRVFILSWL